VVRGAWCSLVGSRRGESLDSFARFAKLSLLRPPLRRPWFDPLARGCEASTHIDTDRKRRSILSRASERLLLATIGLREPRTDRTFESDRKRETRRERERDKNGICGSMHRLGPVFAAWAQEPTDRLQPSTAARRGASPASYVFPSFFFL
jgi:hypothetical protein